MSLPRTVCADSSQHCIVAMSAPMTLVNYSHGANKRVPRGQLASIRTAMPRRPSPTPHGRRLISQHDEQPRLSNLRRWSQPFCSRSCQARSSVRAASAAPVACLQVVHLASNTITAGTPRLLPCPNPASLLQVCTADLYRSGSANLVMLPCGGSLHSTEAGTRAAPSSVLHDMGHALGSSQKDSTGMTQIHADFVCNDLILDQLCDEVLRTYRVRILHIKLRTSVVQQANRVVSRCYVHVDGPYRERLLCNLPETHQLVVCFPAICISQVDYRTPPDPSHAGVRLAPSMRILDVDHAAAGPLNIPMEFCANLMFV
ncbi:hypothetical protein VFPBJ_05272 [Purpureocillium lilacinum]|uniref:Uncharacterized protein n=1 Tax=Purpureocillium lilacinum TaxID=33203 RepID=A0A179GP41_PURLI|nr:hypothetical protein VFPBJ_05272 [Purpureocillium lilacinum]